MTFAQFARDLVLCVVGGVAVLWALAELAWWITKKMWGAE